MRQEHTRTTVTMPARLLRLADEAVREGRAKSRNQLVTEAVEELLSRWEGEGIDAAFQGMSKDADYQEEARQILAGFADSDLEASGHIEKGR
ncbi:MAG: CopG family transcriptional regulator [Chloroflexi bacterium]|nr:CopG family transcriptional regulator [Chloroflexota bacterium]